MQVVESCGPGNAGAQPLNFSFGGLELEGSSQNEPELNHVGRMGNAVISAEFHHFQIQVCPVVIVKHNHGRMSREPKQLLQEPQSLFLKCGRVGSTKVEYENVAPFLQLAKFAELEFAKGARREVSSEHACKSLNQAGIWGRKTDTNLLIKQGYPPGLTRGRANMCTRDTKTAQK